MALLKERLIRELNTLSPGELLAVQQLIDSLKQAPAAPSAGASPAQRVRAALAHLPGSLSETVVQEREERV